MVNIKNKGLTLVEILIGLVILSVAILPIFMNMTQSRYGLKLTEEDFAAGSYAFCLMEDLRNRDFIFFEKLIAKNNIIKESEDKFRQRLSNLSLTPLFLPKPCAKYARFITLKALKKGLFTGPYVISIDVEVSWNKGSMDIKEFDSSLETTKTIHLKNMKVDMLF